MLNLFFSKRLSQIARDVRAWLLRRRLLFIVVLFEQIVVNYRIRGGSLVNPTLVEILCELAVCDDEFEFHKGGDVVVDKCSHVYLLSLV